MENMITLYNKKDEIIGLIPENHPIKCNGNGDLIIGNGIEFYLPQIYINEKDQQTKMGQFIHQFAEQYRQKQLKEKEDQKNKFKKYNELFNLTISLLSNHKIQLYKQLIKNNTNFEDLSNLMKNNYSLKWITTTILPKQHQCIINLTTMFNKPIRIIEPIKNESDGFYTIKYSQQLLNEIYQYICFITEKSKYTNYKLHQ